MHANPPTLLKTSRIMKIIHVAEAFEGGIIEIIRLLSLHMPDLEHLVVHGNRQVDMEKEKLTFPENVKFIHWKTAKREIGLFDDFKAFIELKKILKQNKPFEALHLYSSKAGFLGRLAGKVLGFKNIIYSPQGASFERKDISAFKKKLFIFLEKNASALPGKIISASKSEQKIFEDIGVQSTCIYNGVTLDETYQKSYQNDEFIIVNAARISEQKNPQLFNKIASAFVNQPRVKFVWIGNGPLHNQLTSPNITVTGWVGKEEVEKHLKSASLYLSTALWEGLPLSVLEAMKFHLPLLLSNCVGNVDLVENGKNGFSYTSCDEAIQKINDYLADPHLVEIHGNGSYNLLKREFSIDKMKDKFKEIYLSEINLPAVNYHFT